MSHHDSHVFPFFCARCFLERANVHDDYAGDTSRAGTLRGRRAGRPLKETAHVAPKLVPLRTCNAIGFGATAAAVASLYATACFSCATRLTTLLLTNTSTKLLI